MKKLHQAGRGLLAAALASTLSLGVAQAQMVPDTVDPYELAPRNVHLYPISINARNPFYYVPPIFAPREMWRGALDATEVRQFAPHNYVVQEVPDTTALVAWGEVRKDGKKPGSGTRVHEAANQQQFLMLPPSNLDQGSSYMLVTTRMRYVGDPVDGNYDYDAEALGFLTKEASEVGQTQGRAIRPRFRKSMRDRRPPPDLVREFERELILEPQPRVMSIAETLPVERLLTQYERVDDVADLQPRVHPVLLDELATQPWPVTKIYGSFSGWRRDPNVLRTLGDLTPQWFTFEGKMVALKYSETCGWFMLTVEMQGYNPWYPEEVMKNFMRKMIALSFNEFVEPTRYYDVERPLGFKEWHRLGSTPMDPHDTRFNIGGGSAGQGAY